MVGCRNSEAAILRSSVTENRKSSSPEKEDRCYTTRGSGILDENGKVSMDGNNGDDKGHVWPKLFITLSSKEKEEDFMAMKGCKLPQRPKKRAKIIQRSLLVSLLTINALFSLLAFLFLCDSINYCMKRISGFGFCDWGLFELFRVLSLLCVFNFFFGFRNLGGWQLVSPGAWLTDMCQERYEVREKKSSTSKKVLNCPPFISFPSLEI
jgi:hypothetical protein